MAFPAQPTIISQFMVGPKRRRVFDVVGPASYATGGVPFLPSELGLSSIDILEVHEVRVTSTGVGNLKSGTLSRGADNTTHKLLLQTGAGAEETAAANLSTFTYRCVAEGV